MLTFVISHMRAMCTLAAVIARRMAASQSLRACHALPPVGSGAGLLLNPSDSGTASNDS